ncbi:HEPN domain-containing protein [Hufsiella ginkgonis]|uniref:HEPN domain-containing protein n=1 Tax=Hufsiella ginkgonis TaxID=2695274 RepID=UPI001925A178|nr:HEPN domain-containing protein [Hufsiella ginkgonis]
MENIQTRSMVIPLSHDEQLAQAHQLIAEVFEASDFEYIRLELWQLLKAVTISRPWSFMGDPSGVLLLDKLLTKLITAGRLMLNVAEAEGLDIPNTNYEPFSRQRNEADRQYLLDLEQVHDRYNNTIRRLSLAEAEQPIIAIRQFFANYSYEEWKVILNGWLEYGLGKMSICEATGQCLEVEQYELLEMLLEACHLIHCKTDDGGGPGFYGRRSKPISKSRLTPIIDLIIAAIEPEMIFRVIHPLIKGAADDGYTDLLIVIPDKNCPSFEELEAVAEFCTVKGEKISCSLHKSSALTQALSNGHVYLSLVCTKANLIYQDSTAKLPVLPIGLFGAIVAKATHEFNLGIDKATSFYAGARFHREANDSAMAMFMLQQATESTFRTIAIALYGMERKTHSLRSLKKLNRKLAPQLNEIFPADTEQEERLLKLLEDAYLDARYLADYKIGGDDIQVLMDRVQQVLSTARNVFDERMKVFDIGEL